MASYSNTQQQFYSPVNPESSYFGYGKIVDHYTKLWQPSQTSLNFMSPRISIGREERFKLHSIYWPPHNESPTQQSRMNKQRSDMDSIARQISKRIDEELKNQNRMKRKASTNQKKISQVFGESTRKKNDQIKKQLKRFVLDQKNLEITTRLASSSPKRQSFLRDRNGFRSNLFDGEDEHLHGIVKCELQKMAETNGFKDRVQTVSKMQTTSKRLNLNLPQNYYPGVGTYEIKRYLQDLDISGKRRAVTAREKSEKKQK